MKKIGGNKFLYWLGNVLTNIGTNLATNNKQKVITNMSYDFINPFTLMINFVIDTNEKYQVILQGDFKEKYIEWSKSNKEDMNLLNEDQMFILLTSNRGKWFKKN